MNCFLISADKRSVETMSTPQIHLAQPAWTLPPLILHPFNERVSPAALLDNSKAALILSGLIPNDGSNEEELQRRLLAGRCGETRMLFYLGKDVFRWMNQCTEWAAGIEELQPQALAEQSFARLLTAHSPEAVRDKLAQWGVSDYVSIFSRAIGFYTVFAQPPSIDCCTGEFLRNYYRYADAMYRAWLDSHPSPVITAANFHFDLYASGEYSKLLESEWAE
jgi:hypothetical protein